MSAAKLYTPRVLELATSLADYPWDESLPLKANARSKSCGSTIDLGLHIAGDGRVDRIGLKSQACAIGQAAAAIFANSARGMDGPQIHQSAQAIENWLNGGELPSWPEMVAIAAARDYPARHGAILLAWNAARQLLPSD